MIPLWRILGWEQRDGIVYVPVEYADVPVHVEYADQHVTEPHLLDWLDEECGYWEVGAKVGRPWCAAGWYGGGSIYVEDGDRRTAIVSVVRQVHAAIGGRR